MYFLWHLPSFPSLVATVRNFFLLSTLRASTQQQPYEPFPDAPSPRRPSQSYGTPFGTAESATAAVVDAIVGAGSGAIIGSHKTNA